MPVSTLSRNDELVELLSNIDGKAEIIDGRIVQMPPTGGEPGHAGDEVYASLRAYAKRVLRGKAIGDNKGFLANLPNRGSFSPDAAYYDGPNPGMKFFSQAPVFAVEIRSEGDYGPAAERRLAQKRSDYFEAGTLVVWDVDVLGPDVVRVYRSSDPENPSVYRRGDEAEAEPAVPGWTMPVDDLFWE